MKFPELLEAVDRQPLFTSGFLLAGDTDPREIRRQLSRWVAAGRLVQLRRGLYALAEPYRKTRPHPFVVANRLDPGSYVSRQSALAHFGLIPEHVPVTTSVGNRARRWQTSLGRFDFQELRARLRFGHAPLEVAQGQRASVASPEKALLDLVYLTPRGDDPGFLAELRLQHLERLDLNDLHRLAKGFAKPKLERAAARIQELAEHEARVYEAL